MVSSKRVAQIAASFAQIRVQVVPPLPPTMKTHPIFTHLKTHPKITLIDVYKFIQQGTRGWQHLLQCGNHMVIQKNLYHEFTGLDQSAKKEPVFTLLDNHTQIGRIDLLGWQTTWGRTKEELWNLMLQSIPLIPTSIELFLNRWNSFHRYVEHGWIRILPSNTSGMIDWFTSIQDYASSPQFEGLPLVSHSELYRNTYQPHYRLVVASLLAEQPDLKHDS